MPTVLVVDDDVAIRTVTAEWLMFYGYAAVLAANGAEALDRMRDQTPCLVILDLHMPVMDGWEFLRRQKSDPTLAQVPVICVTGFYGETSPLKDLGILCLEKPVDLDRLLQAVRKTCPPPHEMSDGTN